MGRCLLFTYGLLQPGQKPPRTVAATWPDELTGLLYDLGPWPAAVAIGSGEDRFRGTVVDIDDIELAELDRFEDVAGGEYARRRAVTAGGREVWVYEYLRPIPADAPRIWEWISPSAAGPPRPAR